MDTPPRREREIDSDEDDQAWWLSEVLRLFSFACLAFASMLAVMHVSARVVIDETAFD